MEEMKNWILNELDKGSAVYIENLDLLNAFNKEFLPGNRDERKTEKTIQKALYSLRKEGKIKKKALGVYKARQDYLLGRNWIWAWRKI